jgi:riboflavin kinase/FMN adenylyltransferase
MRIIRDLHELGPLLRPSVVTVGNFDGVHLAHQRLLRSVVETARQTSQTDQTGQMGTVGAVAAAMTFEPHPARLLAPERAPKLLTPLERKVQLIEEQGIELLVVVPFTREFSCLSPLEFARQVLAEKLRAAVVVVGPNFRFGHGHAGDVALLAELGREQEFRTEVLPAVEVRGERVSSSRIRELLSEGRVGAAGRLLGRPFAVCGSIVRGIGVGSKQTVPTLNLAPYEEQLPKRGVYVTHTKVGRETYESVTNVGHKPTFGEHRLTVESFLLNFSGEINAAAMEVEFLHRLRDEMKFPSPAALKTQIQKDARRSVKFFRLLKLFRQRQTQRFAPAGGSD